MKSNQELVLDDDGRFGHPRSFRPAEGGGSHPVPQPLVLSYQAVFPRLPFAQGLPVHPGMVFGFPPNLYPRMSPPQPYYLWPNLPAQPSAPSLEQAQSLPLPQPVQGFQMPPMVAEAGVQTIYELPEPCHCQLPTKSSTQHCDQSNIYFEGPETLSLKSVDPSLRKSDPVDFSSSLRRPSDLLSPPPLKVKLSNLCAAVQVLFIQGSVSREKYDVLSSFEKRLFYYLVKRKFSPKTLRGLEPDDATLSYERLLQVASVQAPRRPEECYKFVLTRVLKHVRRQLESSAGGSPDNAVNQTYFGDLSAQLGVPLADFSYPLAGNQKGKVHFNFRYFSKIFKSEAFLQKIHEYTQSAIFADYQRDLAKKVTALTQKWERMLSNDPAFLDYSQVAILRYVIFNKRCKLPWTQVDVQNAIERMKDLIQICAEGKSNVGGHLIRNAFRQRHEARL